MGSGGPGNIVITGWGFTPGTLACPVLFNSFTVMPCATVLTNGTFSATFVSTFLTYYNKSLPGYVVATIEDNAGNVLAIGSVPGGFTYNTK